MRIPILSFVSKHLPARSSCAAESLTGSVPGPVVDNKYNVWLRSENLHAFQRVQCGFLSRANGDDGCYQWLIWTLKSFDYLVRCYLSFVKAFETNSPRYTLQLHLAEVVQGFLWNDRVATLQPVPTIPG